MGRSDTDPLSRRQFYRWLLISGVGTIALLVVGFSLAGIGEYVNVGPQPDLRIFGIDASTMAGYWQGVTVLVLLQILLVMTRRVTVNPLSNTIFEEGFTLETKRLLYRQWRRHELIWISSAHFALVAIQLGVVASAIIEQFDLLLWAALGNGVATVTILYVKELPAKFFERDDNKTRRRRHQHRSSSPEAELTGGGAESMSPRQ